MDSILGNRSLDNFDVLVIGSGASGSAVAAMLCKLGQHVLVLEGGPNYYIGLDDPDPNKLISRLSNDELKYRRSLLTPDPLVDPRTFRPDESSGARTRIGAIQALPKTVGGGAVHADFATPRFMPADFQLGSMLGDIPGANFADWPITYDQLERFYLYAENALGVQGLAGSHPFDPPRSGPYPMPPGVPMYTGQRFSQAAIQLGYHPFPVPMSINSRPYDGRPPCNDCGYCGGYGCPTHARGSPAVTLLRKALLSGNCQLWHDTRVVALQLSGGKTAIVGVEAITSDGSRRTFHADRYVLAANAIEDVRLLLVSDPQGPGIGNSSGLVGRNLLFHAKRIALGIFDERMHGYRGRDGTHAFADFRGVPGDPNRPLGGIVYANASSQPIAEGIGYATNFAPLGIVGTPLLKKLLRQSPARDRVIFVAMYGEDAPQLTNRVDLDPDVRDADGIPVARITYSPHAFEMQTQKFYEPKLLQLLQQAGARYAALAPMEQPPPTAHNMGVLRFGSDPTRSVCDPAGRFHDVGNLYGCDGALFPTASGFNPTLTIIALATRVAAEMVFPDAPERGLA